MFWFVYVIFFYSKKNKMQKYPSTSSSSIVNDDEIFEFYPSFEITSSGSFPSHYEFENKVYKIFLSDSVDEFKEVCSRYFNSTNSVTTILGNSVGPRIALPSIAKTTPPILSQNPTFLHAALFFNANKIFQDLLSFDSDTFSLSKADDISRHAEHFAAAGGNITFFERLPKTYVFSKDKYNNTFLHYAALYNKPNILKYAAKNCESFLLLKNKNLLTPLDIAILLGHLKCLNPILNSDVFRNKLQSNEKKKTWDRALLFTLNSSNFEIIPYLIEAGMDISQPENDKLPFLHHAADVGSEIVLTQLLKYNYPVDKTDSLLGWTALHCAANNGNRKIVNILLNNGANPCKLTLLGNSPFHIANTFHGNDPNRESAQMIKKAVTKRITLNFVNFFINEYLSQ